MSAIWGCIKLDTNAIIPENALSKMKETYETKCKIDRIEYISFEEGFFACGIQYVTPLAYKEHLPCKNDSGLYFTADCIIDNGDRSIPDGEYLFKQFSEKGPDCLKEILGAYAIAAWNEKEKILYLGTDPLASRCLYYYIRDGILAFSTLIEPIRLIFPDIELNENYIKDFLVAPTLIPNIVASESAYLGIKKIIQGEYVVFNADSDKAVKYFDPKVYNKGMHLRTIKEVDRTFRTLYEKCVGDQIRNEITGVAMSSGLDSSSIAVLAANKIKKEKHGRLLAYTYVPRIKIESSQGFITDETAEVMEIVKQNPIIEPHFLDNKGRNCVEQIPEVVSLTEMPIKAVVNFPNLIELYETSTKDGCRIVLNGQVGNFTVSNGKPDDIFFDLYKKHRYFSLTFSIYRLCRGIGASFTKSYRNFLSGLKRALEQEKHPKNFSDNELSNPYLDKKIFYNYPADERFCGFNYDNGEIVPTDEKKYKSMLITHPSFVYIGEIETKIGLRYGLVIRDPSRDARIISFCHKLSYRFFAYHGMPRSLIRRNFQDLIPKRMLTDWKRYGEQNADWQLRIERDKETIIKSILESLTLANDSDYICVSKIPDDLKAYLTNTNLNKYNMLHILFIYSAICFDNLNKEI
ncbi:MAG: hypothetical protein IKN95_01080 [Lachnospiraceae bacterium]|nr:hypothetical protein [Lachnospiraceae bacterium]